LRPFAGREAIAEAYAAQPSDDEIVLLHEDGTLRLSEGARRPGQMFLTERDGQIRRLTIRYDR